MVFPVGGKVGGWFSLLQVCGQVSFITGDVVYYLFFFYTGEGELVER